MDHSVFLGRVDATLAIPIILRGMRVETPGAIASVDKAGEMAVFDGGFLDRLVCALDPCDAPHKYSNRLPTLRILGVLRLFLRVSAYLLD